MDFLQSSGAFGVEPVRVADLVIVGAAAKLFKNPLQLADWPALTCGPSHGAKVPGNATAGSSRPGPPLEHLRGNVVLNRGLHCRR